MKERKLKTCNFVCEQGVLENNAIKCTWGLIQECNTCLDCFVYGSCFSCKNIDTDLCATCELYSIGRLGF